MSGDDRLFGVPGAEELHFDLACAYEAQIDPYHDEHDNRPNTIEEWSVRDTSDHLPNVGWLLDWVSEWSADNGELTEDGAVAVDDATKADDVKAAFQAALDLLASKVTFRMADKLLRTWTITWDDAGEPFADGAPIYGPRPTGVVR